MSDTPIYDSVCADLEFDPRWTTAIATKNRPVGNNVRAKRHHLIRKA